MFRPYICTCLALRHVTQVCVEVLSPLSRPADRRRLDVRRRLHGGRCLPASHSDDGQLSAVSPPQALALRATLHEPVQRGNVWSQREQQTYYVTAAIREVPLIYLYWFPPNSSTEPKVFD